ncbi:Rz1-like lysis system protein LysC [Enterobacter cloacae complex sp. YD70/O97D2]
MVPISADLTANTPIPGMTVPFTWQASLELNAQLYTALGQCNLDKAGIRKIEADREKKIPKHQMMRPNDIIRWP